MNTMLTFFIDYIINFILFKHYLVFYKQSLNYKFQIV